FRSPNDPNKFVGIVSGHHGVARTGELHLFDISKGTKEEQGRVHQYPSHGRKYVAETKDELVRGKYPQIVHPYPLSEKYIVASVRHLMAKRNTFSICLIDKFDNIVTLQSFDNGDHAFEPLPLQARQKPVEIADKTNPDLDYGHVFLNDIYQGDGLKDVPRGTVKALRILEYHYAYRDMGSHNVIGNEGSWDVKRIHGTVPVLEDGSAMFKVPANRPLALQPLDKDGKALALMRTWFTVMPGEVQSCVGCHEGQGMSPTSKPALASRKAPTKIKPFVAGVRGYSFIRDVQPVLDKYCVGCHNGGNEKLPNFKRNVKGYAHFPKAYLDLAKFVRRSGPECNQNMLIPMEFNADTSELIHILKKGHKGVKLDDQSMKTLITWIDMNVPCFGTWKEIKADIPHNGDVMRRKYLAKYANRHEDQDAITYDGGVQEFVAPAQAKKHQQKNLKADNFPFDSATAKKMVENTVVKAEGFTGLFGAKKNLPPEIECDIDGVKMRFVLIPEGTFVMGSNRGYYDEGPAKVVRIEKPFYMSQFEVTNLQYSKFDASHNSGYHDRQWKDHVNRGYTANNPNQPVVRVNWNQANAYAKWLS
ncbi:MAG: SUMF1/EgtB/PvdO family nonheme iron enzyme, partial [Opitutales bacterium]|nr:SUMF1/EgtB/PvdO family nonheme iron enzyme [Opitutales bacterium]